MAQHSSRVDHSIHGLWARLAVAYRDKSGDNMAKSTSYSAKKAAAGKDIGKKGKNFSKIASKAGKEYGSAAAGKRVAGAVLAKLRKK